ncbi:topoisomerase C-terminal repeat-containing protein [Paenibacillus macquariensis]|uniref:topoisomerase C-terminal repeat-containing protein n=1 Tax=Paenibacillus macquariensis TaxID=948756 RepID=UPI0024529BCB|nr:topoisomerase C-terminal repeat-containing protein [Paenibacillus macquariensis]MEC0090786.1 topoisomerase C-terminal repeat-containing protein [Paenibacillus macquariensis]
MTPCDFTFHKKVLGKSISETQIRNFLERRKTTLVKGVTKGEKTFEAALNWNML